MCFSAERVDSRGFVAVPSTALFAVKKGSGFRNNWITITESASVKAAMKYGPTNFGRPNAEANTPDGSIKFGPVTAPIVEPQTTKDKSLDLFSGVARSIAANLA